MSEWKPEDARRVAHITLSDREIAAAFEAVRFARLSEDFASFSAYSAFVPTTETMGQILSAPYHLEQALALIQKLQPVVDAAQAIFGDAMSPLFDALEALRDSE